MRGAILSLVLIILGIFLLVRRARVSADGGALVPIGGPFGRFLDTYSKFIAPAIMLIGMFLLITRSFVIVGADDVGHLKKIYFGKDLRPGAIIAAEGEKGPQAEILPPGFHFRPFIRVIYDIEYLPTINVPEGHYGFVFARDGRPLRDSQFLSDKWPDGNFDKMMEARYFLTEGQGQKGPQLSVLGPGKYRLNQYLYSVKNMPALDVPTGSVAVIRSNVQTAASCADVIDVKGVVDGKTATPIVSEGCIGVWVKALSPGRYYLNAKAYVPTLISTRLQTWQYKGDYTERKIDLQVTDDGKIVQTETKREIPVPKNAADRAINVRVQGWTVPVEMRVVGQVHPKDAPRVVASVGDLQRVEDNIVTPAIRDILRTIGGTKSCEMLPRELASKDGMQENSAADAEVVETEVSDSGLVEVCTERRVLDFIEKREEITDQVELAIAKEAAKAGFAIQEVRMGEPAIPPELLVARLRKQLADQLTLTYQREREAQQERIEVEKQRETANKQQILVQAEIERKAAEFAKERARLEGEGEKLRQIEIAKGQQAMTNVLGKDRTLQLQMLKEVLAIAQENPDIIKVPMVQVSGEGSSLEGAAAVLGASNFGSMIGSQAGKASE